MDTPRSQTSPPAPIPGAEFYSGGRREKEGQDGLTFGWTWINLE